ncbi:hypothetical protein [Ancylobacter terrae]|uniref:hypothetical protein n=1 Tax=Ancylobacter sp. sgz301288 TaxID=3342077 RepID=UPI00385E2B72
MAFALQGWSRLVAGPSVGIGPGSVRSKYMYVSLDTAAAVETTGYFNVMASQLTVGDQIDCSLDLGGTPRRRDYMVTAIAAGVVTIGAQNVA